MKRFTFLVTLEVPSDTAERDARAYVEEAVDVLKGSFRPPGGYGDDDPGDPLWESRVVSVRNAARVSQPPLDDLVRRLQGAALSGGETGPLCGEAASALQDLHARLALTLR